MKDPGWRLENTYAGLPATLFRPAEPEKAPAPVLLIGNNPLAGELGLDPGIFDRENAALVFGGNELPPGAEPIAQAYAGHQYGHQTMLGDGRALLLGEQGTSGGQRIDIQLKGSGRTAFSRRGDGKAALGPMLREFIISEAMQALGIPTTRSLAVVATGATVWRETPQPGAVLTRTAASHIRVGTFEYAAAVPEQEVLSTLADYTRKRHYPELDGGEFPHRELFAAIMERQIQLVAQWMGVGFVHGVMNTDNMALSGETIDYGPCAFMEAYDPETVFSSIDRHGRYAYGQQPQIAHWNLTRLAESMLPLFAREEKEAVDIANEILAVFPGRFQEVWLGIFCRKLGLFAAGEGDQELLESLLLWMRGARADFTNTFRALDPEGCRPEDPPEFRSWHERWQERLDRQAKPVAEVRALMRANNPAFIPRNHRVEEALTAAVENNNLQPLQRLITVLGRPWEEQAGCADLQEPAPAGSQPYVTYCGT